MKNYYEILGVDITATQEEIRKAYYKQARKYHPDNNPRQDTTNMMQQITLAYNTLSNEESKKQYDATLKRNSRTSFNNTTTNTNNSYSHTQNSEDFWRFFDEYFHEQSEQTQQEERRKQNQREYEKNHRQAQERAKRAQREREEISRQVQEELNQQKEFFKNLNFEYHTMNNIEEMLGVQNKINAFEKIKKKIFKK